jgi:uncharacterized protein
LLAAGANPNAGKGSPLWYAVEQHDYKLTEALVNAGADVNRRGPHETTPLHLACLFGSQRTIQLLLAHGARADLKDDRGVTAAEVALKWHPNLRNLFPTTAPAETK